MSAISATAPLSIGITSLADRQQKSAQHYRKLLPKAVAADPSATAETSGYDGHHHPGDGPIEDATLPADTLFAAALIANEMDFHHATIDEVKLRLSHEWLPPESEFQLTDKTI